MSETMADYEDQINASFRSFREGDTVTGEVVSVEEEEVLLDLRSFSQGVIPSGEYSDDPNFHAMDEIRTGEMLTAVVLSPDDGQGRVLLSLREAKREEAWEQVEKALEERTVFTVKVNNSVNAGVVAYCEGLRGFIPASKLALEYVEQRCILDRGKTDIPMECYLLYGETLEQGIVRLVRQAFPQAPIQDLQFNIMYHFENKVTNRLIYLFILDVEDDNLLRDKQVKDGKLWTFQQIEHNLGKNFFSCCFENEYEHLKDVICTREKYKEF